jgi:hypothetical protein
MASHEGAQVLETCRSRTQRPSSVPHQDTGGVGAWGTHHCAKGKTDRVGGKEGSQVVHGGRVSGA